MNIKLFTPGPIYCDPDLLQELSKQMIQHRDPEYSVIHKRIVENLRKMLFVKGGHVFLFTSSGTGAMESSMRNLVKDRVLVTTCGAFSERWFAVAQENGKAADALAVEWGMAVKPEMIEAKLKTAKYDCVTVTHSETSTGVYNPIKDIGAMLREKFPDVMYAIDAVSSMSGVEIRPEDWGVDMIFASTQKAFGLPPGLAVVWVSDRALEKAKTVPNRGHYFDLLSFAEMEKKHQTPETPVIPLLYGLDRQLQRFFEEGLENRFQRHKDMANIVRKWAKKNFALFPEAGYEAVTLTTVKNTKNIDVDWLNSELRKRGAVISSGYGKVKGKSFRIAHMADLTVQDINALLETIDGILKEKGVL